MKKYIFTLLVALGISFVGYGQEDATSTDMDEIEVSVKEVKINGKGDTAIVKLFLQSYLKNPRELKLNTFSSGILDGKDTPMFYDSMQIGKVIVRASDRQNYIHYLLTRDEPVILTVKTPNWKKQWGRPQQFKLVIEDHQEEGKFLEYIIDL